MINIYFSKTFWTEDAQELYKENYKTWLKYI